MTLPSRDGPREGDGGGSHRVVTETEVGDEESYYEVEITLDDGPRIDPDGGPQIDVQLDESLDVVGSEADVSARAPTTATDAAVFDQTQ